jgi:phage N-6-adenine-methyltransferase
MIIQQLCLFETQPSLIDSNENYTPSDLIDLVHQFYGYPDLDPFSCELANRTVKAQKIFTIQDDGFKQNWRQAKTLWLNPPYSAGFVEKVVDKLIQTLNETEAEAFLLTNTDNSTDWYKKALNQCDRFILPHTRLTFYSPKRAEEGKKQNQNRVSQTLFYFGLQPQRFEVVFEGWGTVCQTSKW